MEPDFCLHNQVSTNSQILSVPWASAVSKADFMFCVAASLVMRQVNLSFSSFLLSDIGNRNNMSCSFLTSWRSLFILDGPASPLPDGAYSAIFKVHAKHGSDLINDSATLVVCEAPPIPCTIWSRDCDKTTSHFSDFFHVFERKISKCSVTTLWQSLLSWTSHYTSGWEVSSCLISAA